MRTGSAMFVAVAFVLAGMDVPTTRAADAAPAPDKYEIAPGPFQASWGSLKQYECPQWFRDAKFGIWAHWDAQCVPELGGWYAHYAYVQGTPYYTFHVRHYGHPSKVGYKDICHLWKAEKWDPERLMRLYQRAGAKYFVALANHHCNFDCWNSKYQPWNSVNIGPKKDIVGIWAKTAREHGLRFGVSVHNARSWDWFDVAHASDKTGPLAGLPYDGALSKADGKGQWWEGYDPADLYGPHGAVRTPQAYQAYVKKWFDRTKDLIDTYNPDLLYFDDAMAPLGDAGLNIFAHYYDANLRRHHGKLEAVLNTKNMPKELLKTLVQDLERGKSEKQELYPWQTDTCIGDWHYSKGVHYSSAGMIVRMLADVVSKNGNLLLSIPVRGDGSIDDEEIGFLEAMAAWMDINGEAIFGTRPWSVCGEGPAHAKLEKYQEKDEFNAQDIRFTAKGDTLYAIVLGWPGPQFVVRSLAKSSPLVTGKLADVRLLGHEGSLQWSRTDAGLVVKLPEKKPCDHAFAFKITGLKTAHASTARVAASIP